MSKEMMLKRKEMKLRSKEMTLKSKEMTLKSKEMAFMGKTYWMVDIGFHRTVAPIAAKILFLAFSARKRLKRKAGIAPPSTGSGTENPLRQAQGDVMFSVVELVETGHKKTASFPNGRL